MAYRTFAHKVGEQTMTAAAFLGLVWLGGAVRCRDRGWRAAIWPYFLGRSLGEVAFWSAAE